MGFPVLERRECCSVIDRRLTIVDLLIVRTKRIAFFQQFARDFRAFGPAGL